MNNSGKSCEDRFHVANERRNNAMAVVTQKVTAIAQNRSRENPTDEETEEFIKATHDVQEIEREMRDFMRAVQAGRIR